MTQIGFQLSPYKFNAIVEFYKHFLGLGLSGFLYPKTISYYLEIEDFLD